MPRANQASARPTQGKLNKFVKQQPRTSATKERRPFNHQSRPKIRRNGGFSPFQIRLVHSILSEVLTEGKPLDKAYAIYFAKVKLEPVEQGFIIRQINAMFRRLSFYAYCACLKRPSDFARHVNRLIVCYCADQGWELPDLDCGEGFDRSHLSQRIGQARNDELLNQGCPQWLNNLGQKELGAKWPTERAALCSEPKRYIRVNTLKTDRDTLASRLSDEGVVTRPVKGIPTALEITSSCALFRTQCFKEGLFEQQDAGSQRIAAFCEVAPHQRVIDACAGAGGKTLHLAALMQNKGQLIALDTAAWRLEELKKRARRAGVSNIEIRPVDSSKILKRLYDSADRVLIDAPCSGTGVLRRTPDSKWRDSTAYLKELQHTQAQILERDCNLVKVGGLLIYSTCSILPSENHNQIATFLAQHPDFSLIDEVQMLPSEGTDGFYMAKLRREAPVATSTEAAQAPTESIEPQNTHAE
ncbi:MAG: RsmB/NOP family class I SAM-dependent RNA methyltransferase [Candidatus Anaerobiospirillum merdipullorum]|uniref:RsmB/NOP family class I SAM-dependent RNA methyltransferase n=1 Tax=Candidatus Anaerobiospirillum merdipullorum TaxID=2838450 RepID=A0A9E2NTA7_9GAMM|nr:RsmB/NOP family class I SAM-dependent RNA methyltransferase [Candidatus Anaerobiospirillum merdipullorum]